MDRTTLIFSTFLLVLALGLAGGHWRAWRIERDGGDDREYALARRKFRRRMQVSFMIGATGVGILVGQWLPAEPMLVLVYWLLMVGWVLWIVLLAAADLLETRHYLEEIRREQLVLRAQLEAELRRRSHEGNGHADKQQQP